MKYSIQCTHVSLCFFSKLLFIKSLLWCRFFLNYSWNHNSFPLIVPRVTTEILKVLAVFSEYRCFCVKFESLQSIKKLVWKLLWILEESTIRAILDQFINAEVVIGQAGESCTEHVHHFHGQIITAWRKVEAYSEVCWSHYQRVVIHIQPNGSNIDLLSPFSVFLVKDLEIVILQRTLPSHYNLNSRKHECIRCLFELPNLNVELVKGVNQHHEIFIRCVAGRTQHKNGPILS